MTFSVEGDYFEVCNCDVSCNCVWLGAATNDNCDVLLAWHVTRGSKDGVDLSGLSAVMAARSLRRGSVVSRAAKHSISERAGEEAALREASLASSSA